MSALFDTYWPAACKQIQSAVHPSTYDRWFGNLLPLEAETTENELVLAADNEFIRGWIADNYADLILKALRVVGAPDGTSLKIVVRAMPAPSAPAPGSAVPPAQEELPLGQGNETVAVLEDSARRTTRKGTQRANLNEQYTFEDFVVGPCNSFAHAAATAVAKKPGMAYNPLFIYGATALGKTHLMQAVGHYVERNEPKKRVCYITTEALLNDYIESLSQNKTIEFRNRYRNVDVLLVDDIQFLIGKTALQEEFFNTFNALHNAHKQIILTSDRPVKELAGLEQRLVSRFEWGLVTSIERPGFETRMAILREKQKANVCQLSDELLTFIAEHITSNVRGLEGALARALSYMSLTGQSLTLDTLRQQLSDIIGQDALPDLTPTAIQKAVAEICGLSLDDMTSKARPQSVAVPRQIAMYLCRCLTHASLPEIGKWFDRNHATVVHSCKTVKGRMPLDDDLRSKVVAAVRKLGRDPSLVLN